MSQKELLKGWAEEDRLYSLHGATPLDEFAEKGTGLIIEQAQGIKIRDINGKEYIDACSGAISANIGYSHPELVQAAAQQMAKLSWYPSHSGVTTTAAVEYSSRLAEFLPDGMQRTFLANSGAEANETAYKMVRFYWANQGQESKYKIISRDMAYHGLNLASSWTTGLERYHKKVGPPIPGISWIPACHCFRCPLGKEYPGCDLDCALALAEAIEREGPETVAAFVAEPIYGTSGNIFPPPEYIPKIREICDNYDVLLILDEVITGFGRTGKNFCCQHWNVLPDLMCISKGMISSHLPLGGVALTDKVFEGMLDPDGFPHLYTTGGHPVSCAVAQKNLEIMVRDKLVENSAKMGAYLLEKFVGLEKYPCVAQAQGLGLFFGIELVKDKESRKALTKAEMDELFMAFLERGVIVRVADSRISLGPPLIVTEADCDQIFEVIEAVVAGLG